jgi:hypothetical protein
MRHQSSVTWVSWILFGAMDSVLHDGMGAGVGRVSGCGYGDGCLTGAQTVRLGGAYHDRMVLSVVAWTGASARPGAAAPRWRRPRRPGRWGRACGVSRMTAD